MCGNKFLFRAHDARSTLFPLIVLRFVLLRNDKARSNCTDYLFHNSINSINDTFEYSRRKNGIESCMKIINILNLRIPSYNEIPVSPLVNMNLMLILRNDTLTYKYASSKLI